MNKQERTYTILRDRIHSGSFAPLERLNIDALAREQLRVQLAATYRIFDMMGWTELIYNHISLRVPGPADSQEKHFLINPFGLHYSEVTASTCALLMHQRRGVSTSNTFAIATMLMPW